MNVYQDWKVKTIIFTYEISISFRSILDIPISTMCKNVQLTRNKTYNLAFNYPAKNNEHKISPSQATGTIVYNADSWRQCT